LIQDEFEVREPLGKLRPYDEGGAPCRLQLGTPIIRRFETRTAPGTAPIFI